MTKSSSENAENSMKFIRPDWEVSSRINVVSTTRLGGVSEAPYDSMNLGLHVHDDEAHVRKNRALMHKEAALPDEPLWLDQVHGTDVVFFDELQPRNETIVADGLCTRDAGHVLCVVTADCLPVVISNEQGSTVAVAHAGWRGLAAGVLQSAVAHFDEGDELHAWLGPAIGAEAFEVGQDVFDAFHERHEANDLAFKPTEVDKYMADIYALARLELNRLRRIQVTGGDYCTYTESALFHSYRRDGVRSGRMATLAWIS